MKGAEGGSNSEGGGCGEDGFSLLESDGWPAFWGGFAVCSHQAKRVKRAQGGNTGQGLTSNSRRRRSLARGLAMESDFARRQQHFRHSSGV